MKTKNIKSYILMLLMLIIFSLLYSATDGILRAISGIAVSVLIGLVVNSFHYGMVTLACLFPITIFSCYFGIIPALILSVSVVLTGIALGITSNIKASPKVGFFVCGGLFISQMLINLIFLQNMQGETMSYIALLRETAFEATSVFKEQAALAPEMAAELDKIMNDIINSTFVLTPAFFIISALLSAGVLTELYFKIRNKTIAKEEKTVFFSALSADGFLSFLFIATFVVIMNTESGIYFDALFNMLVILGFIFYVFGLSYIYFLMGKRGNTSISQQITTIVVIPLLSMLFAFPAFFVIALGLFDGIAGKRRKKAQGED